MNDFQKTILKAILTSQLAIEKASLKALNKDCDVYNSVGNMLTTGAEAKIKEIKKQLKELEIDWILMMKK